MDFAKLADQRAKLKESKKSEKYLNLARELKKELLNLKVTMEPIVTVRLGIIIKGFVLGLKDLEIRRQVEAF